MEIARQLNPKSPSQQDEATLKRLRNKVNSLAITANELVETLNTLKGLSDTHRDTSRNIERFRLTHLTLIIISNISLTIIALFLISLTAKTGVVTSFILYVTSGGASARGVGVLGILIVGSALYWLRTNWRRVYAATEVGIALTTAWITLKEQSILTDPGKQLTLAGAIYLIVRALDNFMQGQKTFEETKKRKKPSPAPLISDAAVSHLQTLTKPEPAQSEPQSQKNVSP